MRPPSPEKSKEKVEECIVLDHTCTAIYKSVRQQSSPVDSLCHILNDDILTSVLVRVCHTVSTMPEIAPGVFNKVLGLWMREIEYWALGLTHLLVSMIETTVIFASPKELQLLGVSRFIAQLT